MAKTTTKNPVSKAQIARKWYKSNMKRKTPRTRIEMVELFMEKANLTKNGANTYFTNCMNNPELNPS